MIDFIFIFVALTILDVATKGLVRRFIPLGGEIKILPFFTLTHVQNTGIAFGMFQHNNSFFIGVGLLLSAVLVWMALRSREKDKFLTGVLGVILAGAWGNLIDRLLYGHVTDFLDFYIGPHHWPAFNVADSAICVGATLLLLMSFRRKT